MVLLKQPSKNVDEKGRPYTDLYLGWVYEGRPYVVRVHHVFACDFDKLLAVAQLVPQGEMLEKYL